MSILTVGDDMINIVDWCHVLAKKSDGICNQECTSHPSSGSGFHVSCHCTAHNPNSKLPFAQSLGTPPLTQLLNLNLISYEGLLQTIVHYNCCLPGHYEAERVCSNTNGTSV